MLNEDQALKLTQHFALIPEEQKGKARELLQEYKDNQASFGMPLFPQQNQRKEQERQALFDSFDDPANVDKHFPDTKTVADNSGDPTATRMRMANAVFMASGLGIGLQDVLADYDNYAARYAHQVFKKPLADERAFYSAAQAHVSNMKLEDEVRQTAFREALLSATDYTASGAKALSKFQAANPGMSDEHAGQFFDVFNSTAFKLPTGLFKGKATRQVVEDMVSGKVSPEDQDIIAALPIDQRNWLLAAGFARATADAKEGSVKEQTGLAFARTLKDMYGGQATRDAVTGLAAQDALIGTQLPEGASAKDILKAALQNQIQVAFSGEAMQQQGELRKLSDEEKKAVRAEIKKMEQGFRVVDAAEQMARTKDPVKNAFASGLGSSAALMGIIALPGGGMASAIGYANSAYKEIMAENPQMDKGKAMAMSNVIGPAMMGLDKLQFRFIKDALPSVRSVIDNGLWKGTITRGLVRAGEGVIFENVQEGTQDALRPVVQAIANAIDKDVPFAGIQKEWSQWADQRGDVLIGTLPLTLVGLGVASIKDIKNASTLLQQERQLQLLGIQAEDRTKVVDLAAQGKLEEAQQALQEAFTNRDPEIAKAAGAKVEEVQQIEAEQQVKKLIERGVMPSFTRTTEGWAVETPDGGIHTAKTWEGAKQFAQQFFADKQQLEVETVGQLADVYFAEYGGQSTQHTVEFAPGEQGNVREQVDLGNITEEQARQDSITAGLLYGLNEEQAQQVMQNVLGTNVTQTRDMVSQAASKLFGGANVFTLTEEMVSEGNLKAAIQQGRITEEEVRAWIDNAEKATGETFLRNDNIIEAVSAIVNADMFGAVRAAQKKGQQAEGVWDRIPVGLVTRGAMQMVKNNPYAGGKLAAYLASWRQFFKQLFRRSKALQQAKASGALGEGHEAFLAKLVGKDTQAVYEASVNQQVNVAAGSLLEHIGKADETIADNPANIAQLNEQVDKAGQKFEEVLAAAKKVASQFTDTKDYNTALRSQLQQALEQGVIPSFSLAPAGFNQGLDRELQKMLTGNSSRQAAVYAAIRQRLARALPVLHSSTAFQLRAQYIQQKYEAELALLEAEHQDAMQAFKMLAEPLEIDHTPGDLQQIRQERDAAVADAKQRKVPRDEIAAIEQEFKSRELSARNASFVADNVSAETDFMRRQQEEKDFHQQQLEYIAEDFAWLREDTASKGTQEMAGVDRKEQKAIRDEIKRHQNEMARLDKEHALAMQASSLRFEGKMREAFKAESQRIELLRKQEEAKFALKKQRIESKSQREQQKALSSEELKKQREDLYAVLRSVDAMLSVLPPEVRKAAGGMAQIARLTTNKALLAHMEKKIRAIDDALEAHLHDYYLKRIKKLVKSNMPSNDKGKVTSDLGAEGAAYVQEVAHWMDAPEAEYLTKTDELDNQLTNSALTQEQKDKLAAQLAIIEQFWNLEERQAQHLEAALNTLRTVIDGEYFQRQLVIGRRRATMEKVRDALKVATGFADDSQHEKNMRDAGMYDETFRGFARRQLLDMSSFEEFLRYTFNGDDQVAQLVDMERKASNSFHDGVHLMDNRINELFSRVAGGTVAGQKLRWKMARPSIDGKQAGTMSEMEAITALMMWAQPEGRRQMEGKIDSHTGQVTSPWSYDQKWIDHIGSQLSPAAFELMNHIQQSYAAEYSELNRLNEERHGVSLPRIDFYAPLTLQPLVVNRNGQLIDPTTGKASQGTVTHPSFIRARNAASFARPVFADALTTFITHTKKVEYWKAFYDVSKQMETMVNDSNFMNAVEAKGGEEARNLLVGWSKVIAYGGLHEALATNAVNGWMSRMAARASGAAILGRVSTLFVQATQLGASLSELPVSAFASGYAKLVTGQLNYTKALNSDFIKRRMASMSPLVRQALVNLGSGKPNTVRHAQYKLGELLGGADALFTAATYTIVEAHQRKAGMAQGLRGADLEMFVKDNTERVVERVAQPIRNTTRSFYENTLTNPWAKAGFAFTSESRQKFAMLAWSAVNIKTEPSKALRTAIAVFAINGLGSYVIKNAWRALKGEDKPEDWDPMAMLYASLSSPAMGFAPFAAVIGATSLFDVAGRSKGAWTRLLKGEDDLFSMEGLKDLELILQALALGREDFSALSSISHGVVDLAKLVDSFTSQN